MAPACGTVVSVRVLLVEDEVGLAETVRRGLTREGFVVEVVHNGQDAVWAATEGRYDVIVLDIMIPLLNGYQVVKELRAREVWTPILMLSAKDGEYDQTDAFDLGADDYLTKPFLHASGGAVASPGPSRCARAARGAHGRRSAPGPGPTRSSPRRHPPASDPSRVRPPGVPADQAW